MGFLVKIKPKHSAIYVFYLISIEWYCELVKTLYDKSPSTYWRHRKTLQQMLGAVLVEADQSNLPSFVFLSKIAIRIPKMP